MIYMKALAVMVVSFFLSKSATLPFATINIKIDKKKN